VKGGEEKEKEGDPAAFLRYLRGREEAITTQGGGGGEERGAGAYPGSWFTITCPLPPACWIRQAQPDREREEKKTPSR